MTLRNYRSPELLGDVELLLATKGRVSLSQGALLLRLHHQTVHKYARLHMIATIKIGSRYYILQEEIERYREHGPLTPSPTTTNED